MEGISHLHMASVGHNQLKRNQTLNMSAILSQPQCQWLNAMHWSYCSLALSHQCVNSLPEADAAGGCGGPSWSAEVGRLVPAELESASCEDAMLVTLSGPAEEEEDAAASSGEPGTLRLLTTTEPRPL